jgi:hypothetical protein
MCQFVSTCEVETEVKEMDGISAVESNKKVLFLTHDDVYKSKKGKEVFGEVPQERLCGHTPVRRFFELKNGQGKEREYTDLSNPDDLPAELVKAIRTGKLVGIGYSTQLLSNDGCEKFDKEVSKMKKSKSKKPFGEFYEVTKIFWDVFKASKANRAEAWI